MEPRQQAATGCEDVHIFLSRGAGDPYPGTQGPLVEVICDGISSCGYEDILYVGTFDRVCESVTTGVVNATNQITTYAENCPESKLVLCGHSEASFPARTSHTLPDISGKSNSSDRVSRGPP
jgi:hypothetical protein